MEIGKYTYGAQHIKQMWDHLGGGYIDSFSMVSVWHCLENTFEVKIPDKEAIPYNFDNVNRMTELVNKFKNKNG